jgi:hypothetical protein
MTGDNMKEVKEILLATNIRSKGDRIRGNNDLMNNETLDDNNNYAVYDYNIRNAITTDMTIDDYFNSLK